MKLKNSIILAGSCFLLSGCADFLDNAPDDTLTMEMVFNDKTRTEDWLSGIYNKIPDPYTGLLKDYGYDSMGDDLDTVTALLPMVGKHIEFHYRTMVY